MTGLNEYTSWVTVGGLTAGGQGWLSSHRSSLYPSWLPRRLLCRNVAPIPNATTILTPTTKQVVVLNGILNGSPSWPFDDAWFKFSCMSLSMEDEALATKVEFIIREKRSNRQSKGICVVGVCYRSCPRSSVV